MEHFGDGLNQFCSGQRLGGGRGLGFVVFMENLVEYWTQMVIKRVNLVDVGIDLTNVLNGGIDVFLCRSIHILNGFIRQKGLEDKHGDEEENIL